MRHLFPIITLALLATAGPLAVAGETPSAAEREAIAQKLAGVGDDAKAAIGLALQLEAKGYDELALKAYEIVIGIDGDNPVARRALGYEKIDDVWRTGDDLKRAKGFVRYDNQWITTEAFAIATRPEREAAEQQAAEKQVMNLLAMIGSDDEETVTKGRRLMVTVDDRYKLAPLARALRLNPPSLRVYAAGELGKLGNPLAVRPLLRCTIKDPDADARQAAAEALKAIDLPSTVHPLGRALDSRFETVRIHAAEALATLGDELAMQYIITKWEGRSGDFPRSYLATTRQISYIQDFDVEVAQTSFIADPIVGVIQEGVVQDVKILATEIIITTVEKAAYVNALQSIGGVDLGNKVGAWKQFWHENGERLLHEREQRYTDAAQARKDR